MCLQSWSPVKRDAQSHPQTRSCSHLEYWEDYCNLEVLGWYPLLKYTCGHKTKNAIATLSGKSPFPKASLRRWFSS